MRFETKNFRVDYQSNDKFLVLLRHSASMQGGSKAVGDIVKNDGEIKFQPKRNEWFTLDDMKEIVEVVEKMTKELK